VTLPLVVGGKTAGGGIDHLPVHYPARRVIRGVYLNVDTFIRTPKLLNLLCLRGINDSAETFMSLNWSKYSYLVMEPAGSLLYHEDPQYTIVFYHFLTPFSPASSLSPKFCVVPLRRQTEFHTHTKQEADLPCLCFSL
jgi:hypothetical protein